MMMMIHLDENENAANEIILVKIYFDFSFYFNHFSVCSNFFYSTKSTIFHFLFVVLVCHVFGCLSVLLMDTHRIVGWRRVVLFSKSKTIKLIKLMQTRVRTIIIHVFFFRIIIIIVVVIYFNCGCGFFGWVKL